MKKGIIFDIKEFAIQDGPGIRTTLFFKGCPLRCQWCHNPEGLSCEKQLMMNQNGCLKCKKCMIKCSHLECEGFTRCVKSCPKGLIKVAGKEYDAEILAASLRQQSEFFDGSGITISGGEPAMQPEFLMELLYHLKGIHTIVETSGYTSLDIFQNIVNSCSMVYLDRKHMDSIKHEELTGVRNEKIAKNMDFLIHSGKKFIIRVPLIPGCNDEETNLVSLAEKLEGAKNLIKVEFLPYNTFAGAKYTMAGMEYKLRHLDSKHYVPQIPEKIYQKMKIPYRILK